MKFAAYKLIGLGYQDRLAGKGTCLSYVFHRGNRCLFQLFHIIAYRFRDKIHGTGYEGGYTRNRMLVNYADTIFLHKHA